MSLVSRIVLISAMVLLSVRSGDANDSSAFHSMLKKELNLTKEQEEKLAKLYSPDKSHVKTCYIEMDKAESDFEKVLHSSDSSEKEIREKFEVLQIAQQTYAKARVDKIISIRSILTKEQQAKFLKILEEKKKRKEIKK